MNNTVTPQSNSQDTFIHLSKDNRYSSEVILSIHGSERTVRVYQDIEATYSMNCPICLDTLQNTVFYCSDYTHLACRRCAKEYLKSAKATASDSSIGCWICREVKATSFNDATKKFKAWANYLPFAPYYCPNACRPRPVGDLDDLKEHLTECTNLTCFDCKVKYSDNQSLLCWITPTNARSNI